MFPTRRITTSGGGDVFRDEYSLAFDGTNDYVETGFVANYIHTNATISFWIKMNDFSGTQLIGTHKDKRWYFGFEGTDGFIGVADSYKDDITISPTPVVGEWIHYCVTAIGGTATLYINGVAQGTDSYTQSSGTNPATGFFIGAREAASVGQYINGSISELVQYNVGLTANQVKTIYNGREPYNHKEGVASGNLQAWWRMGDGDLDGFDSKEDGLIQNYNSKVESSKLTSWTNGTAGFNTIVISDSDIASMINDDSGTDNVRSNSMSVATTDIYKVSFNVSGSSIPSSNDELMFKVSPNNALNSATYDGNITGKGDYVFYIQPETTTIYVGFRAVVDVNCSIANFKMQKITNNAGLMKNMEVGDFEGDTP